MQEEVPVVLLQTTAGLDRYGEQQEGPNKNREASNVSSMLAEGSPEQEESAAAEDLPSVGILERQGTKGEDTHSLKPAHPTRGVFAGRPEIALPKRKRPMRVKIQRVNLLGSDNPNQEHEGSPDREASRDGDGQVGDESRGSAKTASNNGDDQGDGQCREGDNTEVEGEDEGARPEGSRTTGSKGCTRSARSSWGEAQRMACPTLPIRIMTRQEQA